ncbi:MAG: hypothetical protein JXB49_05730 [Bacteroidales bacterium]|nr:hypothetical protein [Bacteroidales bacterium]
MSKCCEVFSALKDPRGWDTMVEALPQMTSLPSTLIPPDIPSNMIKYDKTEGTKEILIVTKTFLLEDEESKEEVTEIFQINFGKARLFSALEVIPQNQLTTIAVELNYTDHEIELLLSRVYN